LEIAAMVDVGKRADDIQAIPCNIKTKADTVGDIDDPSPIRGGRSRVKLIDLVRRAERFGLVSDRKAHDFAIIGKWRHRAYSPSGIHGRAKRLDASGRQDRVCVQEQEVTPAGLLEGTIDRMNEAEIALVAQQTDAPLSGDGIEVIAYPRIR